jgi:hypothetical protein
MPVMRTVLIYLFRHRPLQNAFVREPISRRTDWRCVAGEETRDAMTVVLEPNSRGKVSATGLRCGVLSFVQAQPFRVPS